MKHLRLIAFGLLSLGLLMGGINGALSFKTRAFAQGASLPKVNVPFFSGEIPFPEMAVFWFGRITPTENFVDVRVGYNPQHIYIYVAVIDRLLWYDTTPSADDLTNWDAVTLYLSVAEANTIGPMRTDSWPSSTPLQKTRRTISKLIGAPARAGHLSLSILRQRRAGAAMPLITMRILTGVGP
jgi:hypothetical protein